MGLILKVVLLGISRNLALKVDFLVTSAHIPLAVLAMEFAS